MIGLNPGSTAGFEEFGQSLVFEAPNHAKKCNLCRIGCQRRGREAYNALVYGRTA